MAKLTAAQRKALPSAPAKAPLAIGSRDRAIEFARAKRHSRLVRILKIALPVAAAGILSLYLVPAFLTFRFGKGGTATVKSVTLEKGALKMLNPRVKGENDKQGVYDMEADSATQEVQNADLLYLDRVHGKITAHDGSVTTLTAPNAVYDNKTEVMTFNNGALVTRGPGMSATFRTATAYMKQQMVVSKTPVVVRLHESTIDAQTMTLYSGEERAIFQGAVKTHLERHPAAPDPKAQVPPSQSGPAAGTLTAPR